MKLLKQLSLSLIFLASILPMQAQPSQDQVLEVTTKKSPQWREFFRDNASSIVIGGAIGLITGGLSAGAVDEAMRQKSELAAWIVWVIEWNIRNVVIEGIQKEFDKYYIPHGKSGMYAAAWLASWAAYAKGINLTTNKN
jgi:hypothetical protein